jgi:hypothetical protein
MSKSLKNAIIYLCAFITFAFHFSAKAQSYCTPGKSKPCGKGCISLYKKCHKPYTSSLVGVNPNSSSKAVYENPKLVSPEEYENLTNKK